LKNFLDEILNHRGAGPLSKHRVELRLFFQNETKKTNDDGDEISTSTDLLTNNSDEAQDEAVLRAEISSLELSRTSTSALLTYFNLTQKPLALMIINKQKKNAFEFALGAACVENVSLP